MAHAGGGEGRKRGGGEVKHASDCAIHNPPALRAGSCNCGQNKRRRVLVIHADDEINAKVRAMADKAGVSISSMLEFLVRLGLDEYGS